MVEDVAVQLLSQPNQPVISVKKLKNAVRVALNEKNASATDTALAADKQIATKNENGQLDMDDLRKLVYSLIKPLQKAVYSDNRYSLYNKDGIGLHFALNSAECREYLERGDDEMFYYGIFTKQKRAEQASAIESGEANLNGEDAVPGIIASGEGENRDSERLDCVSLSSKSSYSAQIGEDFILPAAPKQRQTS